MAQRLSFQSSADNPESPVLRTLRRLVLLVFLVGVVGTFAELLLLGHWEDSWQLVPLVLLGLGLVVVGWLLVAAGPASVWTFRIVTLLFVAGGLLGLVLHYQGNMEFELEVYPSLAGWELFKQAVTGATPALAPGAMVQLGLLGLAATFRHPAVAPKTSSQGEIR